MCNALGWLHNTTYGIIDIARYLQCYTNHNLPLRLVLPYQFFVNASNQGACEKEFLGEKESNKFGTLCTRRNCFRRVDSWVLTMRDRSQNITLEHCQLFVLGELPIAKTGTNRVVHQSWNGIYWCMVSIELWLACGAVSYREVLTSTVVPTDARRLSAAPSPRSTYQKALRLGLRQLASVCRDKKSWGTEMDVLGSDVDVLGDGDATVYIDPWRQIWWMQLWAFSKTVIAMVNDCRMTKARRTRISPALMLATMFPEKPPYWLIAPHTKYKTALTWTKFNFSFELFISLSMIPSVFFYFFVPYLAHPLHTQPRPERRRRGWTESTAHIHSLFRLLGWETGKPPSVSMRFTAIPFRPIPSRSWHWTPDG